MFLKQSILILVVGFLAGSCSSPMRSFSGDRPTQSAYISELRYEIADVKHALNNTQVELQILEEQLKKNKHPTVSSDLEKKIAQLEESQRKMSEEIRQLSKHATQTGTCLSEYKIKISELEKNIHQQHSALGEISQLKSNLVSISQALQKEEDLGDIYKVRSGDSLEKIARMHKVTVKEIKEINNLSQDKIKVGQELLIPFSK